MGSEAGEVAPEVGLGDIEEASSLEDRWGLLSASPSVSPEAEGLGEGQGWLSRRQCGQLRGRQGTGGAAVCPLASQLVSLLHLVFLRRQGRDRGGWWRKQRERRATPSVLGELGCSGKVGPQLPFRAG